MKKVIITLAIALSGYCSNAQTNTFPSTGNVGIGTTSPNASLHVMGTTQPLRLGYDASNYASFQVSTGGNLIIYPTSGTLISGSATNTASSFNLYRNSATVGGLTSANNVFSVFGGTVPATHLTISSIGQVGIGSGTANLATTRINNSSLHTFSSGEAQLTITSTSANIYSDALVLKRSGTLPNTHAQGILFADVNSMQAAIRAKRLNVGSNYQSDLQFYTGDGISEFQDETNLRMTIDHTGKVGIGTATPDQKLTVNGTIHSKEVKVDTSIPIPDYVFDTNYRLPELSELKSYLEAYHHLPEIPSAPEIEKNGLNLSEMNLKLLKKIEELTLYLIKKDEQVTAQQQKIENQEERIAALENMRNAGEK